MPGPPDGPSLRITSTSPGTTRRRRSPPLHASSDSKTRAGPVVAAAVGARDLHDGALGRQVAAQRDEADGRLERAVRV